MIIGFSNMALLVILVREVFLECGSKSLIRVVLRESKRRKVEDGE